MITEIMYMGLAAVLLVLIYAGVDAWGSWGRDRWRAWNRGRGQAGGQ